MSYGMVTPVRYTQFLILSIYTDRILCQKKKNTRVLKPPVDQISATLFWTSMSIIKKREWTLTSGIGSDRVKHHHYNYISIRTCLNRFRCCTPSADTFRLWRRSPQTSGARRRSLRPPPQFGPIPYSLSYATATAAFETDGVGFERGVHPLR